MTQLLAIDDYLDEIIQIEQQAHTHPWAMSLLTKKEGKFDCNRALVKDNQVIGYFYAQCVAGEATLLNLVIAPAFQAQGFAKPLLHSFLNEMQARGATEAWLEVRASNQKAISLYTQIGFNEFDKRVNYYPTANGKEDAIVMSYWFE